MKNNQYLTWWECGDDKTQLWSNPPVAKRKLDSKIPNFKKPKKLTKKVQSSKEDKVKVPSKRFSLVLSTQPNWHIYAAPSKLVGQMTAKITTGNQGWRQEFFYDPRTKSIRVVTMPRLALSNTPNFGLDTGKQIEFRLFKGEVDQVVRSSHRHVVNTKKDCLTASNN